MIGCLVSVHLYELIELVTLGAAIRDCMERCTELRANIASSQAKFRGMSRLELHEFLLSRHVTSRFVTVLGTIRESLERNAAI